MKFFVLFIISALTVPSTLCAPIGWTEHTINDNFSGACSVYAIDVDGDSLIDVLGTAIDAHCITWWRNDGGEPIEWIEQTIDSNFMGACYVYAKDVDGDEDIDILGAAWYGHEIAWWRNGGGDPIEWTKQTIDGNFINAHEVFAVDMDADEDVDVLAASAGLNEIAWWRNDGGEPIQWIKHTIDDNFYGARSVMAIDVNNDSLLDVLGAALVSNEITLWLNNGDSTWTEQTIADNFLAAHKVYACDVDGDDDIDVLGAAYTSNAITWWRNDGGFPIEWTEQAIDEYFYGALTVYAADVDGDDDTDVLGAANAADDIAWWRNDGGTPIEWSKQTIDGFFNGAWPVFAKDVDGDGDIDVLAGADTADDITWWESDLTGIEEIHATPVTDCGSGPTIFSGPLRLPTDKNFKIFDVTGKTVEPDKMRAGIYFIRVDDRSIIKVIKIR
jgi:hypothetical protein